MECYLVGGAVRDELLGLPVTDRDWVVVGATPAELKANGFTQVGRDFPVFLHPETHEEYALARTERKTAPGHRGFVVHAGEEVTLEEDLIRRDLTINAIAKGTDGNIIDPHGGRRDIEARQLRHVSPAFEEDPLRVFRVARFAAVLADFELAPETRTLMTRMCEAGRLRELSAERVAQELLKVLRKGGQPKRFLAVLADVGGLHDWFPEWQGVEPPLLSKELEDESLSYAALCEPLSVRAIEQLGERLKLKLELTRLATVAVATAERLPRWRTLPLGELKALLLACAAFRSNSVLDALASLYRQQHRLELEPLPAWVERVGESVTGKKLIAAGQPPGPELGAALERARFDALDALRRGEGAAPEDADPH